MRVPAVLIQGSLRSWVAALALALAGVAAVPAHAQPSPYNTITLQWVAPGDDGTTGQVSGYEVRYSTTPDPANDAPLSQRITIGPPLAASGQADSFVVTGLAPSTHYYFAIRAFDDGFNFSDFSNVADDTTWTCTAPTAAPSSFNAVASLGQVDVSWGATSDPLAQSLHLYRAVGTNGAFSQIQSLSVGQTNYTDTNVNAGQIYRYRAAYAGAACEGPISSVAQVSVPSPTPPPGAPAASPSTIHVYPNPATTSLRVVVDNQAPSPMPVYLRLFDMSGHWMATVVNGTYPSGTTEVPWNRVGRDGRSVGAGYYELLGTVGVTKVRERLVLLP